MKELVVGYLAAFIHPDRADEPEVRHYQKLLADSVTARERGDHWTAQRLASAAHRWAMLEMSRLQHLAHEREVLDAANERLQAAWDRDRSCATLAEFQERYPEHRRLAVAWEAAEARVRELSKVVEPEEVAFVEASPNVRERRAYFKDSARQRRSYTES